MIGMKFQWNRSWATFSLFVVQLPDVGVALELLLGQRKPFRVVCIVRPLDMIRDDSPGSHLRWTKFTCESDKVDDYVGGGGRDVDLIQTKKKDKIRTKIPAAPHR